MADRQEPSPVAALLGLSLFLTGIAAAAATPYRAIIAIDEIGIDRALFGATMTGGAIAGAIVSMALGAWADRVQDRRPMALVCALVAAVGYGMVWLVPSPASLILSTAALMPFATATVSQTYAYSRAWYDDHRPGKGAQAMSRLRTTFSAAWIVMPPLAGWIAATTSVLDVYGIAALACLGTTASFFVLMTRPEGGTVKPAPMVGGVALAFPARRRVGVLGVLGLRVPILLQMMTVPLVLTHDLGASLGQVGINAAIAAALEVPFMLAWGALIPRLGLERILGIAGVIFAAYLVLMSRVHSVPMAYALQVVNALGQSALLSITISYMQETIRGRVGLSTALMDGVTVSATLIASSLFGFWPTGGSYQPLLVVGGALSAMGAATVWASRVREDAGKARQTRGGK